MSNQNFHLFASFTKLSIMGTSIRTPTTVANAAPEFNPNNAIATATANSKKLLAPIIAAGAHILYGSFKNLPENHVMKKIK